MWVLTELMHHKKMSDEKGSLSVSHALRKIDTPSILFFVGILMSIAALSASGILTEFASVLNDHLKDQSLIGFSMGIISAVIDNVPLVAAMQAMYPLSAFPTDHYFWELLAYCTGTGGSILVIGSAAGVAAMGIEKLSFFWYLKKISLLALLGYAAGAAVVVLQ
jgi:Na+/H+ antiporter NhaD/arsenite permease-like protein